MYNYCTLFNSHYLTRGLAMYESLKKQTADFHLYIFAFDDRSCHLLKKLDLCNVTVIALSEFEDEALLKIKNSRSIGEYCWTCTPSVIKYAIETYQLTHCTYLDADLYFFADPAVLIEEMAEESVLITDHRYTAEYDQTATSGKYCVQFMTFKNDDNGMKVLNWWRDACINWCYNRFEDGKFGDQKYLDNWLNEFNGVHELKNLGGGVAPWNIQQYQFLCQNKQILGTELATKNDFQLIFYHFHYFKFLENEKLELGTYKLTSPQIELIYKPYILHLHKIKNQLNRIDTEYDYHGTDKTIADWKSKLRVLKRFLKGNYNVFPLKNFI